MSHPIPSRVDFPTWLKTGASTRTAHYFLSRYLTACELRNLYTISITHGIKAKKCPLCVSKLLSMGITIDEIDKTWAKILSDPK